MNSNHINIIIFLLIFIFATVEFIIIKKIKSRKNELKIETYKSLLKSYIIKNIDFDKYSLEYGLDYYSFSIFQTVSILDKVKSNKEEFIYYNKLSDLEKQYLVESFIDNMHIRELLEKIYNEKLKSSIDEMETLERVTAEYNKFIKEE